MGVRSLADLEALLASVRAAPSEVGSVTLIVRRPAVNAREEVGEVELDVDRGLIGDSWIERPSKDTPDRSPSRERQLTLMSARSIGAIAERQRWALAGDQFFVDFDLSAENLPAGTRLQLGTAIVEVSAVPHAGCAKFSERFGSDALKWVNSPLGRELRLRGLNARIISGGAVRTGDVLRRA